MSAGRIISRLVARTAAQAGQIQTVINYLATERATLADAAELYHLMFPSMPTTLPQFYTDPAAFLLIYYFETARNTERWEGATVEEFDREMLNQITLEASTAIEAARAFYGNQHAAWRHWMLVTHASQHETQLETNYWLSRLYHAAWIQKLEAGTVLNLDDRRSAVRVLDLNPFPLKQLNINCAVCNSESETMCVKCSVAVCSRPCQINHSCC